MLMMMADAPDPADHGNLTLLCRHIKGSAQFADKPVGFEHPGRRRGQQRLDAFARLRLEENRLHEAFHRLRTVALTPAVDAVVLRYVNRLSDLLFVIARVVNHRAGLPEVAW